MTIYEVVEYITEDFLKDGSGENASGMFSTKEKAKNAILARIAEEYTQEEINAMDLPQDIDDWEYVVIPDNEWVTGCTYIMYTYELDYKIE